MNTLSYKRTKFACYFTNLSMSVAFSLPPLLFATFHKLYGISYTLLGTLVLISFCAQLGIDLFFSFFGKHFDLHKVLRTTPLLTATGFFVYALIPLLLPQYAYFGLVAGTVIFSVAAGLGEVLISPTIAALPSDTPEKDMSTLHSLYGYGFVGVVLVSTICLECIGIQYWMYLALFWAALPLAASILLMTCKFPDIQMNHTQSKQSSGHRRMGLSLCVACIFLGSSAENTMSNWISVYTENILHMPKLWGDVFGMCLFALLLALTRTAYAKWGKNIFRVLVLSMAGATICYVLAALSPSSMLSLLACIAMGVFTSMLWPGTLIFMEEKIPMAGVTAYALMAAGGDLGASVAPQALGIVVDTVSLSQWANDLAVSLQLSAEDIGFKAGMLLAAVFPALGLLLLAYMKRHFRKSP